MATIRIRSPNYPAISLPQAIDRISVLYKKQHKHPAPREVVAKHLGFGGLSGPASTLISALHKYGLLDRAGQESRISQRALQILFPDDPEERAEAIRAAASEPQLFAELNERFPSSVPGDELLQNYLSRRNFSPGAIGDVIRAFKETAEFVEREVGGYDSPDDPPQEQRAMIGTTSPPRPQSAPPMIGIMEDGRLTVHATLNDQESIDALIEKLKALRTIAPPRPTIGGSAPEVDEEDEFPA